MAERRFTDREVREILERAVSGESSTSLTRSEGLSLGELKVIGEEVGIDPARIEKAAGEVARGETTRANPLVGAPPSLTVARRVEGSFDPSNSGEALSVIRRTMGIQGEAAQVGGALEWTSKGSREHLVTVRSDGRTTTVEGSVDLRRTISDHFATAGICSAILTAIFLQLSLDQATPSMVGLVIALSVIPGAWLGLRQLMRGIARKESEALRRTVDDVALLVGDAEDPSNTEPGIEP